MTNPKLNTISAEIRQHMARAFFASAWADQCDESGNENRIAGREIMDEMPEQVDPSAEQAAKTLELGLLEKNKQFSCLAGVLDWLQTVPSPGGDRPRNAEMLGHYLAMQAMGHGVGLYDAFGDQTYEFLTVPYVEFGSHSLEKDYF